MSCINAISSSKNEILIKLHVLPGSSHSVFPVGFNKWRNSIEIKVKAEARENKANNEVIVKIAEYFNISTKDITIINGQRSREKTVSIKNLKIEDVCKKIEGSLKGL